MPFRLGTRLVACRSLTSISRTCPALLNTACSFCEATLPPGIQRRSLTTNYSVTRRSAKFIVRLPSTISREVPNSPTFKTTHKIYCPRGWHGKPFLTHLLARWPSLLQFVHLTVFPPAVDFSLIEEMAPSSSSNISTAWDSKIDSPLLRTMVWIR